MLIEILSPIYIYTVYHMWPYSFLFWLATTRLASRMRRSGICIRPMRCITAYDLTPEGIGRRYEYVFAAACGCCLLRIVVACDRCNRPTPA